jgi:pantoate--beta-alanine ligase
MALLLFKKSDDWLRWREKSLAGKTIGFVPTMGALHNGHLSLVKKSKEENNVTVCSIFINPTQFNDWNDFSKYPSEIESDILKLTETGCDILFLPSMEEMYPEGNPVLKKFDLGEWENILEGADRHGHFQGVANIVSRLLDKIQPDKMYLGQKDFQQVLILKKLLQIENRKSKIVMCPIVRETDGLAMSSRNVRLNVEDRKNATGIHQVLLFVKENFKNYSIEYLEKIAAETLNKIPNGKVAYFKILDADSLREAVKFESGEYKKVIALTSVVVGGTRLLDNMLL